jgi:tetratricopeptide (TPR) repeat protein
VTPTLVAAAGAEQRLAAVEAQLAELTSSGDATQLQLRRAVLAYERASLSGRDDDLRTVRCELGPLVATGTAHDDLALVLVQAHLDSHALREAEAVLDAYPRADVASGGRSSRATVLQQRGETVAAGRLCAELVVSDPSWRPVAALAGVYADLDDVVTADGLLQLAADDIDARHLGALAWVETSRARLHRGRGDLARADFHLRRAELAYGGWKVAVDRALWLLASGRAAEAASLLTTVVERTDRPDHHQALASALRASGRTEEAAVHVAAAAQGYAEAAAETPWRYLHHQVSWHLEEDQDLDEALRLARRDHAERPSAHPVRALAEVHRRRGESAQAEHLLQGLEREQEKAVQALRPSLETVLDAWARAAG